MPGGGDFALFASAAFVLIFSSMFATYAIQENYGVTIEGVDFGFDRQEVANIQDFTNRNSFTSENIITSGIFVPNGNWTLINGTGYQLQEDYLITTPVLLINNIISDTKGVYDITYTIYNPSKTKFMIYPRYIATGDMIEIRIDNDGYHIPDYITGLMIAFSDHYYQAGSGLLDNTNMTIRTVYDSNNDVLTVYKDGYLAFSTSQGVSDNSIELASKWFGGVSSQNQGFTLVKMTGLFAQYDTGSSTGTAGTSGDWLSFATTLFKLITWQIPDAYFPWWASVICIDFPALICVVFGLKLIRGN